MTQKNYEQYLRVATSAAEHGVELTVEERQKLQRRIDNLANEFDPLATLTVQERRATGGLTLKRLLHR